MNVTAEVPALLALDAGVRETGWAVFKNGEVIESGVTGLSITSQSGTRGPDLSPDRVSERSGQPIAASNRGPLPTQRHQLAGSGVGPAGVFAG